MGTQKRNYKHGGQRHLHRSIMAITSGPIYLKHKKYFILSILIGWQAYRGDQRHRKNSPS